VRFSIINSIYNKNENNMKKVKLTESELVHLIKRVITETTPTNVYRRWQGQNNQLGNCKPSGIQNFHMTQGCTTSPTCNTPQQNNDAWVAMGSPSPGEFVKGVGLGNPKCWKYLGTSPTPQSGANGAAPYKPSLTFTTLTNCNDCFTSLPTGGACDATAWSGYNTWVSNWTNGGPFNSPNPKQPCTHICKKIQQWTMMSTGTVPLCTNQSNVVQCKLDEGNNQSQIKGCNC